MFEELLGESKFMNFYARKLLLSWDIFVCDQSKLGKFKTDSVKTQTINGTISVHVASSLFYNSVLSVS